MNANEARFQRQILEGRGRYEPVRITITRRKERKYTPDFLFETEGGVRAIVEVKGAYKLQSEERARLAWEIAAEGDATGAVFVWARARRGGYDCEAWFDNGRRIEKRRVANGEDFGRLIAAGKEEAECRAE